MDTSWICCILLLIQHKGGTFVNMAPVFNTSTTLTTLTHTENDFSEALVSNPFYTYMYILIM